MITAALQVTTVILRGPVRQTALHYYAPGIEEKFSDPILRLPHHFRG